MSNEAKMLELKACPACDYPDAGPEVSHATGLNNIECPACGVMGPCNDPTGEKWNALPRREDLFMHCGSCRNLLESFVMGDGNGRYYCSESCGNQALDKLRDEFAKTVLLYTASKYYPQAASKEAYVYADAMLAERQKHKKGAK